MPAASPSALERFAALIQSPDLAAHAAARMDRLRLHIADTVGMMLQGASLVEGKRAIATGSRLLASCACARLTEADDIHLTSCTTPGSVVVPTALLLASTGAYHNFGEFVTSVLAGYETLIRVGYAIDGPRILAKKLWPTLFAARAGATAVASRAWRLDVTQTAGALATALAASTGIAAPAMSENSSRWIALGAAAEDGVLAATAAKHGAFGDVGFQISGRRLAKNAGSRFFFDEIGLKPYPVARQALAAVEACRQLAGDKTKGISEITVRVPTAHTGIIDRAAWPSNRMQSIAGAQYQIALALLSPARLMDFNRTPPFETRELRSLAAKIRVRGDARLDALYPAAWPARVTVVHSGKHESMSLTFPRGDARNPMDWEDVFLKTAPYRGLLTTIRTTSWQEPFDLVPMIYSNFDNLHATR
jgi:2-methylcitrate dehydratase PrpD